MFNVDAFEHTSGRHELASHLLISRHCAAGLSCSCLSVCLFLSLLVSSFICAAILDQVIRWQIIPKQWGNVSNPPWALMAAQRKKGARGLRIAPQQARAAPHGAGNELHADRQGHDRHPLRCDQERAPRPSSSSCASHDGSAGNPRGPNGEPQMLHGPRWNLHTQLGSTLLHEQLPFRPVASQAQSSSQAERHQHRWIPCCRCCPLMLEQAWSRTKYVFRSWVAESAL